MAVTVGKSDAEATACRGGRAMNGFSVSAYGEGRRGERSLARDERSG
jgi:hypothetical protein